MSEEKPVGPGHNFTADVEKTKTIMDKMDKIEATRETSNADMGLCTAELEELGLNKHAVRMARQFGKLDADKREGFEISFDITRQALGIVSQGEMFSADGKVKDPK